MGNCMKTILRLFYKDVIHRISGKKLRQIKQLAEGGYGFVSLVQDIESKKNYALKKIICQTPEQKQMYQHEIKIMKELSNCSHIIGFYGCHEIERNGYLQAYILMELGEKTVYDLIYEQQKKGKIMNEYEILKILKDIVLGIKQMHQAGIIHRDIKVENVLLSRDSVAKLCDFGSSSKQKINLLKIKKSEIYKYEEEFQKNTTLMYRPPQMIDLYLKYPIDEKVDIWMLGCVLFVMNYHYHPFQQEGKLSIINASIKYKKSISQKMENFIRLLLTPNPKYRPSIEEILKIIDQWEEKNYLQLNAVAKIIKQNQIMIEKGQYEKIKQNDWKKLQEELK